MREHGCGGGHGGWRRLGIAVASLVLPLTIALPAAAQTTAEAQSPESDQVAVADSTQSYIATVEVDPQAAFEAAFVACVEATGDIHACTEEVEENLGLEQEEYAIVDETPYNPNDVAASVVEDAPLTVDPPLPPES